jgi:hypothetical protein
MAADVELARAHARVGLIRALGLLGAADTVVRSPRALTPGFRLRLWLLEWITPPPGEHHAHGRTDDRRNERNQECGAVRRFVNRSYGHRSYHA